jgi:hypothetical protein
LSIVAGPELVRVLVVIKAGIGVGCAQLEPGPPVLLAAVIAVSREGHRAHFMATISSAIVSRAEAELRPNGGND